jgi:hypothetical protein
MIQYRSKAYMAIAWLAKTWLPIASMAGAGVAMMTGFDFALAATFISGVMIPVFSKMLRDSKAAATDPGWADPEGGGE